MAAIPRVLTRDPELRPFLEALKENIERGEGSRGDPLKRYVRIEDLLGSKAFQLDPGISVGRYVDPSSLKLVYTSSSGSGSSEEGELNLTPPPKPTGLVVTQGATGAFLQWDKASYGNHAYTKVYRSTEDNFSNATFHSLAVGSIFSDSIPYEVLDPETGAIKGYYYWISFLSDAGNGQTVEGAPNATAGTYGEPSTDPAYYLDVLSKDGEANAPFFAIDEETEINGILIPPGTYIKELFVADGTFGTAKIRDLAVDKLIGNLGEFVQLNTPDASIGSAKLENVIQSDNYDATNGWLINRNGLAVLNQAVIRGSIESFGYSAAGQGFQLNSDGSFTLRGPGGTVILSTAGVPMNAITGAGDLAYLNSIPNGTYLANAIVDTLHLKGQSVTIPKSAYTSGSTYISQSGTTAVSLTYTSTGNPAFITATFVIDSNSMAVENSGAAAFTVELRRGSTVLYSQQLSGLEGLDDEYGQYGYKSYPITLAFRTTPSSSSHTFSVRIKKTSGNNVSKVSKRSLMILEVQR